MPQMESYDSTSNLLDHMESYKALLIIQGANDALFYLVFPATLCKAAQAWYYGLKPRSIYSFKQLERQFMTYFNASWRMPQDPDNLFSIHLQKGESLKNYMAQFMAAMLEIYHQDESMAMFAMKRGFHPF